MKRTIACLLACMLLIPGMLMYVSAEERYVEDLSTVDWDKVIDNRICLRENKDLVPDDYEWTVEDFPELELEDVFDNGYSIYLILKDSGRESLTYAIEQMALREEFYEVSLCHVVEVDPDFPVDTTTIPDETTVPAEDIQTIEPTTTDETIGGIETTDEIIGGTETTGEPNGEKPTSPQTGDAGKYAACICAVALLGVAGVVIYRKRRSA